MTVCDGAIFLSLVWVGARILANRCVAEIV